MFTGFNLDADYDFNSYKEYGVDLFKANKAEVKKTLNTFMLGDGSINGSAIQKNWFPQIHADVFISHSHEDENKAIGLAGFLNHEFGLTAFIDSCVWGYANDILRQIDNTFCKNPEGHTYDYDKRNYSTSHVHMMLATALTMMIDNTECIIFLNSPSAITSSDVINNQTMSPWIYHELAMTKIIRKKTPESHRLKLLKAKAAFAEDSAPQLNISYAVDLGHLCDVNYLDLCMWAVTHLMNKSETSHALDGLYKLKQIPVTTLEETIYG